METTLRRSLTLLGMAQLEDALHRYIPEGTKCSFELLDVLDELRMKAVGDLEYELAGVVKEFRIKLIKRTRFLEKDLV